MINRDNLVAEEFYCAGVSVAERQWPEAQKALREVQQAIPGLKIKIPERWSYHNGGYYYKEILLDHKHPGRAFEAANYIAGCIRHIPCR